MSASVGEPSTSGLLPVFLARARVTATLVRPGSAMPTVPLAAVALGVPESRIVKSIVFHQRRDATRVCVVVAPGDARVQASKVAATLGWPGLTLAAPAVVLASTGYSVGGVPPLGYVQTLPVVLDASLLALTEVYGGGGDEWHMLRVAPAEILRVTDARVADVLAPARTSAGGGA